MDSTPKPLAPTAREEQALAVYAGTPMPDSDARLLLDDDDCLDLAGLADHEDEVAGSRLLELVATSSTRVVVSIARRQALLRPQDFALWRDLHSALRDSDVELLPVRALPAASAPRARASRDARPHSPAGPRSPA